jgi:hypothetical protein
MASAGAPNSDLALSMADIHAVCEDWGAALRWLEVSAAFGPLPRSYRRKQREWIRRARRTGADERPRSHRRTAVLEPLE